MVLWRTLVMEFVPERKLTDSDERRPCGEFRTFLNANRQELHGCGFSQVFVLIGFVWVSVSYPHTDRALIYDEEEISSQGLSDPAEA